MTTFPISTTVDTYTLQPGEIIHMYFVFYDVTSIRGFNSILTILFAKTIMDISYCIQKISCLHYSLQKRTTLMQTC